MNWIRQQKRRNQRRGMTFVEVMVAISIISVIFLAAAMMQMAAARQTRSLYGESRTLSRVHKALDHMRYELSEALIGSALVSSDGRAIRFHNPMLSSTPGQPISAYVFRNGQLLYFRNISQPDKRHEIPLLHDVEFEIMGPGRSIEVTITARKDFAWAQPRPYRVVEEITLRN